MDRQCDHPAIASPHGHRQRPACASELGHSRWQPSSDHAARNDGSGPAWVASIVNAIGNSAYWANTAIIITWDDWGGWYDHVAPKVINDGLSWGSGYVYGFRVPLIVVSPYAKAAYISHVTHDFGSILPRMSMIPSNTVKLGSNKAEQMLKMMEKLEDNDDVQNVYANFDIDQNNVMEKLS